MTIKNTKESIQNLINILGIGVFFFITIIACFFILKDANWIFGDNIERLETTAQGFIEPITYHIGSGRFVPFAHFDWNILTLIPGATTAKAHFVYSCVSFVIFSFLFFLTLTFIKNNYGKYNKTIFLIPLFYICLLLSPSFNDLFMDIIYPERVLIILEVSFVYLLLKALHTNKPLYYIFCSVIVLYATYVKEPVSGMFFIFGATMLLFNYKNLTKASKIFCFFLLGNFLVYLLLYYFIVFKNTSLFYNEGRVLCARFEITKHIFSSNLFLLIALFLSSIRIYDLLINKNKKHLFFDTCLFSGLGFTVAYILLKLEENYYFTPSVILFFIVFFYWCVQFTHLWKKCILLLFFLLYFPSNFYSTFAHLERYYQRRKTFVPLLQTLIQTEKNGGHIYWYNKDLSYNYKHFYNQVLSWQKMVLEQSMDLIEHLPKKKHFIEINTFENNFTENDIICFSYVNLKKGETLEQFKKKCQAKGHCKNSKTFEGIIFFQKN